METSDFIWYYIMSSTSRRNGSTILGATPRDRLHPPSWRGRTIDMLISLDKYTHQAWKHIMFTTTQYVSCTWSCMWSKRSSWIKSLCIPWDHMSQTNSRQLFKLLIICRQRCRRCAPYIINCTQCYNHLLTLTSHVDNNLMHPYRRVSTTRQHFTLCSAFKACYLR